MHEGQAPQSASITAWAAALAVMMLALLAPALWNGFPLIFADTGGYLARAFDRDLAIGRSALYGVFLAASVALDFWPVVIIQSALSVWLIVLTLRLYGFGGRAWLAAAVVVILCAVTGIAFYTTQLIPDIFVPLAVLALHLLTFQRAELTMIERVSLLELIAVAIAFHMAILALVLALFFVFACWQLTIRWTKLPRPHLVLPFCAIVAGILLSLGSNFAIGGKFAFTPGGTSFLFGRLVQDGIVARYLDDNCPNDKIRLCAYRATLPKTTDDWLWAYGTPFYQLGGAAEYEPEEKRIIAASLAAYPLMHLRTAMSGSLEQFFTFRTMTTLDAADNAHALETLSRLTPQLTAKIASARQQKMGAIDLTAFNWVHVPAGFAATAFLLAAFALYWRQRGEVTALLVSIMVAFMANAAIAGIFSNPVDRYQSRLLWLAPLGLLMAWFSRRSVKLPR